MVVLLYFKLDKKYFLKTEYKMNNILHDIKKIYN